MTGPGPAVGTRLGRYEIVELIGAGGMGVVYRAHDVRLNRDVALKVLPPGTIGDETARRHLRNEALNLSRLNHPNIATVHDFDTENDVDFLVSELIQGVSLDARLQAGPLGEDDVIRLANELADGLVAAHAERIVHRDLKPANLRLTSDGRLKILDFGIAMMQSRPDAVTRTSVGTDLTSGTLAYMAPEQLRGEEVDARTDIWAAGVVLFEMATARRPFQARTESALAGQILHTSPASAQERGAVLSPGLEHIILKCLEKDPARRYQSAAELRVDLLRLAAKTPMGIVRPGTRRAVVVTMAIVVAAAVIGLAAYGWRYWRVYEPPLEAMQWYDRGMTALRDGAYYSAARMFDRSISLDRNFALAHGRLAEIWMELDEGNRAREELLLAVPPSGIRRHLTPLQQQYLDAVYKTVTADYTGAVAQYEAIARAASAERAIEARIDLARALEKARNVDGALAQYESVVRQTRAYPVVFLRRGSILARKGKYRDALASTNDGLQLHKTANNLEGVAIALHQRALIEVSHGAKSDAERDLRDALELARNSGNLLIQVRALTELSRQASLSADMALSERYGKQAADLARSQGAENLVTRAEFVQGNVSLVKGDYARAETHFREGLALARRFHAEDLESRMLFGLASTHTQQSRAAEAIPEIEQALASFERRKVAEDVVLSRLVLGRALRLHGELDRALDVFTRARQAARDHGSKSSERLAIQGIAAVLEDTERLPEALQRYKESQAADPDEALGSAYDKLSIAGLLWQLGRAAEARTVYKEVAQAAAKAGYKDLARSVELGLAGLELSERAWREARGRLVSLSRNLTDDYVVEFNILQSHVANAPGQHNEAVRAAQKAVSAAEERGAIVWQRRAELALAEAELGAGTFRVAFERALRLETVFAKAGQLESRWRALAIASLAARAMGDRARALECAASAEQVRSEFEQRCGAAFAGYRSRKDVQRLLGELRTVGRSRA